eukprot:1369749-Amorphochlora_amoeboformis.AAC.1
MARRLTLTAINGCCIAVRGLTEVVGAQDLPGINHLGMTLGTNFYMVRRHRSVPKSPKRA